VVPGGDVEAYFPVADHEFLQPGQAGVDRIVGAGEDVQGEATAETGQGSGVGGARRRRLEGPDAGRVQAEAAPRVVDVGVDLGGVARQPVEVRAGGLERRVEGGEIELHLGIEEHRNL